MGGVKINVAFQPLYLSNKRFFLVTGGRGSLKTSSVHDWVARLTYEQGHGILFTRYTMKSAEKSIIPEFKVALSRLNATQDFTITKNLVTNNETGSFILFSGIKTSSGDQTANLKSLSGITTWIIEEGEDFTDEKVFNDIQRSIRASHTQNRIVWIQNPTTKEHFIYKKFIEKTNKIVNIQGYSVTLSSHPKVEHIHTTYHIADKLGYLNADWVDEAKEYERKANEDYRDFINSEGDYGRDKHESEYYYTYIGGWLERAEGVVFRFEEGEFDSSLPYVHGQDWGFTDPLALTKVAVDVKLKRIYLQQRIYESQISDVAKKYESIRISKKELIITDTNEPRTKNQLTKLGYNIQNAVKEKVIDDIREIKKYTIIITPESIELKRDFNNYVWDDKKAEITKNEHKHGPDSMRYGFRRLITKERKIVVYN